MRKSIKIRAAILALICTFNFSGGLTSQNSYAESCITVSAAKITDDSVLVAGAEDSVKVTVGDITFRKYDTYAECIFCDTKESKIEIPTEIDGVPVTAINQSAFAQSNTLTEVLIPDSVTEIRDGAFYQCFKLRSVVIPDSVTLLGRGVFAYCTALKSVNIPSGVTTLDSSLFSECLALTEINVSHSNPIYYSEDGILFDKTKETLICFPANHASTEYSIPDTVQRIGNSAFRECTKLTTLIIPDSVTEIGENAFDSCTGLTKLGLPNSLRSIGATAFQHCTGLKTMQIPASITELSDGLFGYCTGLEAVTLTDTLTAIGIQAFSGCTSLETVVIPNAVNRIGKGTFSGCTNLISVTLPDGVTVIEDSMFWGCESLESIKIPATVTSIEQMAFYQCSALQSVDIPEGVKEIGNHAFYHCTVLGSVTLPESLEKLGNSVFRQCDALTELVFKNSECEVGNIEEISSNCVIYTIPDSAIARLAETNGYTVKSLNATALGDVNLDGKVSVADAVLLQKWLLAVPDTHLPNWQAADLYEDGRLDVFDLCLLKRNILNDRNNSSAVESIPFTILQKEWVYLPNTVSEYDNGGGFVTSSLSDLQKVVREEQIDLNENSLESLRKYESVYENYNILALYTQMGASSRIISVDSIKIVDDTLTVSITTIDSIYATPDMLSQLLLIKIDKAISDNISNVTLNNKIQIKE